MVKKLPANVGDVKDACSIPGSGRSPGEGNGNPLQHSCLGNPMDKEAEYSPWGHTESDMVSKHAQHSLMSKCEQSQKHGLHLWYLALILRPGVDGVSLTGPRGNFPSQVLPET